MKSLNRQHILLAVLALIALVRAGDWVLTTMIDGPLQERQARTAQLQQDIEKRETLLAEARTAGQQIQAWQQRSLPADVELARSLYRGWILGLIRQTKLRNATVDSGSAANRGGVYRSLPCSIRARGTLQQFNEFLYRFTKADHLHQIASLSLSPIGTSGQFDISVGVEALLLPGVRRERLNAGESTMLASASLKDYDVIYRNNIFGIGVDHADPMKHTLVSAITFSNGVPQVWITQQLLDTTTRAGLHDTIDTVALTGTIMEVREQEVVIESAGDRLLLPIGKPFSEAHILSSPSDLNAD